MVDSISNILPIQVVGTISGTTASGLPTSIFSLANIQHVVIVNEDPLEVNIIGGIDEEPLIAATGTFSQSLTVSGVPVDIAGVGGGLNNVVEDVTPELGGDLDALNNDIVNIDAFTAVTGTVTSGITFGTGSITIASDVIHLPEGSEGVPTILGPAQGTGIWFSVDNANPAIEFAIEGQDGFRMTEDTDGVKKLEARGNEIVIHAGGDSPVGAPAFAFNTATKTGMYLPGEKEYNLALVVTGTEILTISGHADENGDPLDKGIVVNGQVAATSGTFTTGLTIGTGSTYIFPDELRVPVVKVADGAVGAPSITFGADTDTGIYRSSEDVFRLVASGIYLTVGNDKLMLSKTLDANSVDIIGAASVTSDTGVFTSSLTVSGEPVVVGTAGVFSSEITVASGTSGGVVGLVETDHTFIVEPEDKDYPIDTHAEYDYQVTSARHTMSAGTATTSVTINGTVIEGINDVSLTTSTGIATATSANNVSRGDRVILGVSGTTGAADLEFSLRLERTT